MAFASRSVMQQLRQEQTLTAVGRLAGGLAHVLNNALAVVLGYAEMIGHMAGQNEAIAEAAQSICESAGKAADLATQFLSFGQRRMLQPEPVDLNDVLRLAKDFGPPLLGGRIALEMRPAAEPCRVFVDRQELWGALVNLMTNAGEAMAEGGKVTVAVSSRDDAAGRGHAQIRVIDNGRGMGAEELAHAFEPFFTTKDLSKGAGLGLSTVHGFVNQSGGHVRLESEPGKGTTVTIELPLMAA